MRAARFVVAALMTLTTAAGAQVAGSTTRARIQARPLRGARQQPGAVAPADRPALERRVRQAFAGVVRRQLNLDDEHMRTLQRVDQKYEQQRRAILRDERAARLNLKMAMEDSTGQPDQEKIAQYMDQLVQAQRSRADVLAAEQKEFASFLTPLQRAKYFALRERVNRKLLELQADSLAGAARGTGGPPPP